MRRLVNPALDPALDTDAFLALVGGFGGRHPVVLVLRDSQSL